MDEWGVVGVIVVLIGLIASVVKPVITLNNVITQLTEIVKQLKADMEELTSRNSSTHARIFDRLDKDEHAIAEHEMRITMIEKEAQK